MPGGPGRVPEALQRREGRLRPDRGQPGGHRPRRRHLLRRPRPARQQLGHRHLPLDRHRPLGARAAHRAPTMVVRSAPTDASSAVGAVAGGARTAVECSAVGQVRSGADGHEQQLAAHRSEPVRPRRRCGGPRVSRPADLVDDLFAETPTVEVTAARPGLRRDPPAAVAADPPRARSPRARCPRTPGTGARPAAAPDPRRATPSSPGRPDRGRRRAARRGRRARRHRHRRAQRGELGRRAGRLRRRRRQRAPRRRARCAWWRRRRSGRARKASWCWPRAGPRPPRTRSPRT